jgi:hypothetical protein
LLLPRLSAPQPPLPSCTSRIAACGILFFDAMQSSLTLSLSV